MKPRISFQGEGGMLTINDDRFINRSEIIWEKGTNRAEFFRGEVNKYGWVDTGSSFLPSEIIAAFLWAQIENIEDIQSRRIYLRKLYFDEISKLDLESIKLPYIPDYATNNAHMFYLVTKNEKHRTELIRRLNINGYNAVFHYLSLHSSPYYKNKYDGKPLKNSDHFTECLVRLPLFYELEEKNIIEMVKLIF